MTEAEETNSTESVNANQEPPKTIRRIAFAAGTAAIGLIVLLAFITLFTKAESELTSDLIGEAAPAVKGLAINGCKVEGSTEREACTVDLEEQEGWVALNFFALWCTGCIREHPELVEFSRWGAERGDASILAVVFSSTDFEGINNFFAQNQGDWPVIDAPSVSRSFEVSMIPETFLIDPNGKVVQHYTGEVKAADLISFIEQNDS